MCGISFIIMLSIVMLSVILSALGLALHFFYYCADCRYMDCHLGLLLRFLYYYAEYGYAEFHYAVCRGALLAG
jgi:hypothetical protein